MKDFDPYSDLQPAEVLPEWIDGNGHVNVAYYVLAFDRALDSFCDYVGIGWKAIPERNQSIFVLETHVSYIKEVVNGDPLKFTLQLLDHDEKRLHFFMRMLHGTENYLAATSEQIALHVDLSNRRGAPMPKEAQERLARIFTLHKTFPLPPEAGRKIGIRRRVNA